MELLDVSGFEVIAIKACEGSPWNGDSYLTCGAVGEAWPPLGVTVRDVDGATIGTGPEQAGSILVGVKLAAGASSGRISGIRIYYSYLGAEYLVEEPWILEMPPS